MAASLCLPYALGHAQEAAPAKARRSAPAAAAKPAGTDAARTGEAEARYRAWVDREHARDSADFRKEKAKIEDKYKGYVRPKRAKKKSAKPGESPDKGK